uniref:THD domain-containing protein n=1 Tax=Echeneis naucrates TaxID=173247 RepID=A0A665UB41_ECHNA
MNLDMESGRQAGMEGQVRCCHRYLLLQVWCSLLTVAVIVMAAFLTSVKPKAAEDGVLKHIQQNTSQANLLQSGPFTSYIQLKKSTDNRAWEKSSGCPSCPLSLHNDSVLCMKTSLYLIYAQVTFTKQSSGRHRKVVTLRRNPSEGKSMKKLAEGIFPNSTEGSVWVANIVKLSRGDSISLDVVDDFLKDHTYWGVLQLD